MKISTRLVSDFVIWLDQHGIAGQSLVAKHVADYLDDRWLHRRRRRGDAFTLHTFARIVAPDVYKASSGQEAAISPSQRVRREFEQYLLCERGLTAASIRLYGDPVDAFLKANLDPQRFAWTNSLHLMSLVSYRPRRRAYAIQSRLKS